MRVFVVVLIVTVLSACADYGALPSLRAVPEVSLYYAGSTVIREGENPRTDGPDGGGPATVGHNLATTATPDQVSRFYERELGSKGWVSGWSIGNDPGELNALWRKGDLVFQLTAYGSDYDSVAAQTAKAAGYPTGYTAIVQFDPTSTPTR